MKDRKLPGATEWVVNVDTSGGKTVNNKRLGLTLSANAGLLWVDAERPVHMTAVPLAAIQELLR